MLVDCFIPTKYGASYMAIATINPATGAVLETFQPLSDSQIEAKLALAAATFPEFRRLTFAARASMMSKAAGILESEKEDLGRLMTTEMGKTFRSAVDEAVKCAWACRYYAENAENFLADEVVETNAKRSYIRYQPLGVILAVMPWNFPFWQVFRFISTSLMAGRLGSVEIQGDNILLGQPFLFTKENIDNFNF